MKGKIFIGLLAMLMLSFSACKKCQICEYSDSQGNMLDKAELCGNKEQLANQKTQFEIKAKNINGKFLCVEKK